LNVLEVVEPKNETARIRTAAIIPNRTAYSTALAPLSLCMMSISIARFGGGDQA
jgi:hypothetical protein